MTARPEAPNGTKNTKATKATTKKSATTKGAKGKAPSKKNAPGRTAPVEAKPGSKLARELATLGKLGKTELWERYEAVFGRKTRSCNTNHLRSAIAQQLQSGATAKPTKLAVSLTREGRANGERDPRLPKVGVILTREHKGTTDKMKVVDDGARRWRRGRRMPRKSQGQLKWWGNRYSVRVRFRDGRRRWVPLPDDL